MQLLPRSLRARLVVLFTIGTTLVVVVSLALLYAVLDRQLHDAVDADLAGRSNDLAASIRTGDVSAISDDLMAQLYAADGTVLASSASLASRRLLGSGQVAAVRSTDLASATLPIGHLGQSVRVRMLTRRLSPTGPVLAVAVPSAAVESGSTRQLVVLALAAPLLAAGLGAFGWLLVRAALRPVDQLTREAAAISTLDTGRRLPAVPGDDEFARLAGTLDGMLGRLAIAFDRERAFVDDASHELRTPLAVLRGEIELALAALDDRAEVEQSLLAARGQADRLTRLAEDLLLLARERAGTLVVHREPVDLSELALAEVAGLAPVVGLDVDAAGEPLVVDADAGKLRQVLANLAANSAAAGATAARLRVDVDTGSARIEWADDGPGFAPELLESAFERFVSGDSARTGGGAGLGLPIVRAVVAAHGGSVRIRNGPPLGGAVVTVRLPLS
ncbi:MAG TPA: HAMP domain-containing sensor histidine kinase [Mycobacteriales bacterium]